jgi:predicted NodU family carbamoyl transferase
LALTTLGLPGAHVLNRDGEVLVCSPGNVLNMIFGTDSQFLIVKNISVVQDAVTV